jgi:hypothetical protein
MILASARPVEDFPDLGGQACDWKQMLVTYPAPLVFLFSSEKH